MVRRTTIIVSLLAVFFTFFASTSMASAANTSNTSVDIATMQKTCVVLNIHLNGSQHTITCLQARTRNSPLPNLYRSPCASPNILIYNYNNTASLCFSGGGYLGVNIYQVNQVANLGGDSIAPGSMWIRYYRSGGVTCTIPFGNSKNFGGGTTNVEVTQLDYGASNGGNC